MEDPRPEPGDFASVMHAANPMRRAPLTHPFGAPVQGIVQGGRGQSAPIQQTTQIFYLPKASDEYDILMNRAWAGEIEIRWEKESWSKEGELILAVCWFFRRAAPRLAEVIVDGDVEPGEKPHKLP